jgi:DNA-binding NarL/FixJ family response regulator
MREEEGGERCRPMRYGPPALERAGLAQGASNAVIARRLMLSVKTVGNYVSNIFGKLQVVDRAEAIIRAREAGLN